MNTWESVVTFWCGYLFSYNMDPNDHGSNASGSMDHNKWEKSKCDHADINRSTWVFLYLYMDITLYAIYIFYWSSN